MNVLSQKTTAATLMSAVWSTLWTVPVWSDEALFIEEIVVTSRKREESLQDIPIAVTAFSANTIEEAGIDEVNDFVNLTPNIIFRETFRAGVTFITMRGITTPQQGLPPVTYVVDGVQVGALDFINQGLVDIERIEVLKGPQGALYGAGAMAGAINVVTKSPGNDTEFGVKVKYGDGNDAGLSALASGAIVPDRLFYRINAAYRDFDGLVQNTAGQDVDFLESHSLKARFVLDLDPVVVDLRLGTADYDQGAAMQDLAGGTSKKAINSFRNFHPQSDVVGREDRAFDEATLKIDWETPLGTVTSITSQHEVEQDLFGDADWNNTDVLGLAALADLFGLDPDTVTGRLQMLGDDFDVFSQEIRITSPSEQPLRWVAGAYYQEREGTNFLSIPFGINGDQVGPSLFTRIDEKDDEIMAFFAQVNYDISDTLELTLALRHDDVEYDTTQVDGDGNIIPALDANGNPVNRLENNDSELQPKISLAYDWTDSVMVYATYAEGFRQGFFNTGNLTLAENTKNYELGFKSSLLDRRLTLNGAVFHIDYSDQQVTQVINEPPFRLTTNIPETDIDGLELELAARLTEGLDLNIGLGVIDSEVSDGTDAPATPDYTFNATLSYRHPLGNGMDWLTRTDYRRQGRFFVKPDNLFEVTPKDYLNLRSSLRAENWSAGLFVDNLLDEQQANDVTDFGAEIGVVRSWSRPRTYGVEFSWML